MGRDGGIRRLLSMGLNLVENFDNSIPKLEHRKSRFRMTVLENVSIVLVHTMQPGNLGSAARAMKNMGLKRMKLVNPCNPGDEDCRKMAVGAFDLIENAQIYKNLQDALADESVIIGTTSSRGRIRKMSLYTPREIAPTITDYASSQKVSILFGPERGGLSDDELAVCQYLVSIPASDDFPTLNLAQSVLILCYEIALRRPGSSHPRRKLVLESERRQMFEHVQETLVQIGFLSRSNPGHIMRSIKRLLSQAELTERDVQIVRGIMSQMEWYSKEGWKMDPDEVTKP